MASLYLLLCPFPHQSQSLLQKAKDLYLVEEQGQAGRPQVDMETAGLAVPLGLGPP